MKIAEVYLRKGGGAITTTAIAQIMLYIPAGSTFIESVPVLV